MRILPFGDRAILVEFGELDATMDAYRVLETSRLAGVVELVPAARTVLIRVDPTVLPLRSAEQWVSAVVAESGQRGGGQTGGDLRGGGQSGGDPSSDETLDAATVTIPVRYDGPDLTDTARLLGVTPDDLIARHTGTLWRCAFIGFAPGFAYLAGGGLDVPRRATSRERVPVGAVGLAGEFTGVYPRLSPGGWQLIGTTDVALWDETRDPPSIIAPGVAVRFEAVTL